GLLMRDQNRRLQDRMARYLAAGAAQSQSAAAQLPLQSRYAPVGPLTSASANVAARMVSRGQLGRLNRKLVQGGFSAERHLRLFLAAQLALAVLLASGGYAWLQAYGGSGRSPLLMVIMIATLGVLGFYLP